MKSVSKPSKYFDQRKGGNMNKQKVRTIQAPTSKEPFAINNSYLHLSFVVRCLVTISYFSITKETRM